MTLYCHVPRQLVYLRTRSFLGCTLPTKHHLRWITLNTKASAATKRNGWTSQSIAFSNSQHVRHVSSSITEPDVAEPAAENAQMKDLMENLNQMAASQASPAVALKEAKSIAPIPALPDKVYGYPTPIVTEADIKTYLVPLYSRLWSIASKGVGVKRAAIMLTAKFVFKEFDAAVEFLNGVADIAREENHHPKLALTTDKSKHAVRVTTHTHSVPNTPTSRGPYLAITLRDCRLAILVETLFSEKYETIGRGEARLPRRTTEIGHPISIEESLAKVLQNKTFVKSSTTICPACRSTHPLATCTVRRFVIPPKPCQNCGGPHWTLDCSLLPTKTVDGEK